MLLLRGFIGEFPAPGGLYMWKEKLTIGIVLLKLIEWPDTGQVEYKAIIVKYIPLLLYTV